jgi:hypothetical protein
MLLAVYGTGVASAGATSGRVLFAGKEPGRCTLCIRSCNAFVAVLPAVMASGRLCHWMSAVER